MSDATYQNEALAGAIGLFDEPDALLHAAGKVRDAGYTEWDCHTPYPVHGLDQAMGLRPSPIPMICLLAGFGGAGLGFFFMWWTSVVDYPVLIGGKPLFSWPAFIPPTFEFFVLFAALTTFACVLFFCRLFRWHSPLHDADVMREVTTTRFGIVLKAEDARFSWTEAQRLLAEAGCTDIRPLPVWQASGSAAGEHDQEGVRP